MWSKIVNHCHNEQATSTTWYGALIFMGFTCVMLYLITVDDVPTSSILTEVKQTHEAVKTLLSTTGKMDKQIDRMESALLDGFEPDTVSILNQYDKDLPR